MFPEHAHQPPPRPTKEVIDARFQQPKAAMVGREIRKLNQPEVEQALQTSLWNRVCRGKVKRTQTLAEKLERVKGIEPSYSAWKAAALPLSYTRNRAALAPPHCGTAAS
jgi:hypothetical protein